MLLSLRHCLPRQPARQNSGRLATRLAGWLLSPFILDELRRVPRLANRHGLTRLRWMTWWTCWPFRLKLIEPAGRTATLRDANDQPVLGTLLAAQAGRANYLVTGDKDLLALAFVTPSSRLLRFGVHGG